MLTASSDRNRGSLNLSWGDVSSNITGTYVMDKLILILE